MPKRSPCPISCGLDIIGDRWTLIIIRDLFTGKTHYKEFMASPEKIATNILAARLRLLQQEEIVKKISSDQIPGKFAYQLTDKGRALYPVLKALGRWGLTHIEGTQAKIKLEEINITDTD